MTPSSTLNEGRPWRAGNPLGDRDRLAVVVCRSTKAGPGGPATHARREPPGPRPGQRSTKAGPGGPATLRGGGAVERDPARSTKAGPGGPATLGHGHGLAGLEPRSTKAGPGGPATRIEAGNPWMRVQSAQRRPALAGRQPRRRRPAPLVDDQPRSTKAGPGGPATLDGAVGVAGVAERSTKAGPGGPATPASATCAPGGRSTPLNEGRPWRAGNPTRSCHEK